MHGNMDVKFTHFYSYFTNKWGPLWNNLAQCEAIVQLRKHKVRLSSSLAESLLYSVRSTYDAVIQAEGRKESDMEGRAQTTIGSKMSVSRVNTVR
jgi:hypothetical protein